MRQAQEMSFPFFQRKVFLSFRESFDIDTKTWNAGMPECRIARTPERRNAETPERRNAGTPERQNAGTPERRNTKTRNA